MQNIINSIKKSFSPEKIVQPGIYQYLSPGDDPRNYRLHLRVEDDGNGILIINASTILHLNQTATEYAYFLINNASPEIVAKHISRRYKVQPAVAKQDYLDLSERIQDLINTPDLDPVTFLDMERVVPFSGHISAPYRLDCAITYRLPGQDDPKSAPTERVKKELDTSEWIKIIDKAWSIGIPHIVFTGGEPTLRDDLPVLLQQTENNGQVSGLLTNGIRLSEPAYLKDLLLTGLDYVMIVYSDKKEVKDGLQACLKEDLFVSVHLTLKEGNFETISRHIEEFQKVGVKGISLSAHKQNLTSRLEILRNKIAELQLDLIWNLPVPYSSLNPIEFETDFKGKISGEGKGWLYIEPDGDVLPAQDINHVLGNFLEDDWGIIWKGQNN
jgi:MoaA/NifB/PqqE/SkfB family radical SAM enzyme